MVLLTEMFSPNKVLVGTQKKKEEELVADDFVQLDQFLFLNQKLKTKSPTSVEVEK